ncbi:MAG: DMT family transporter [Proteobacteria bacterium]|nr:DMT family transporter [Pseudomonadota bacterium]MDA1070117.1 DMT family transporter [Pseudomonadota bacterium]
MTRETRALPVDHGRPSARQILGANGGLALAMLMWGGAFPVIEELLVSWDVVLNTTLRMGCGAGVLMVVFLVSERGRIRKGPVPWGKVMLLGTLGFGVNSLVFTAGVANAGGANAAMVAALSPIIGAIAGRLINGEPLRRSTMIAAAIAIAGCLVVVFARMQDVGEFRGGALLVLVAMSMWTWYSVQAQRWLAGWSQVRIAAFTATAGVMVMLVFAGIGLALGLVGTRTDFSLPSLVMIAYLAATSNGAALVLWSNGVKVLGVSVATLFSNTIPIIAVVISFVIFDRPPLPLELLGGAIVILGVLYGQIARMRGGR